MGIVRFAGGTNLFNGRGYVTFEFEEPSEAEAKLVQVTTPEKHGDDEDAVGAMVEFSTQYLAEHTE